MHKSYITFNFFSSYFTKIYINYFYYRPKNALSAINKKITHDNPHTAGFGLLVKLLL